MHDKFESLILDSQVPAAIFGNPARREYVLIDLGPGAMPDLRNCGFYFIGVTGIVGGAPCTEFAVEMDEASLTAIAYAWIQHLSGVIAAKLRPDSPPCTDSPNRQDDSEQWLTHLLSLPDTRHA